MTYPESEIRRVLKEMRFMSVSDDECDRGSFSDFGGGSTSGGGAGGQY